MIKTFGTQEEFEAYVSGGLRSGDIYYVEENGSCHFRTNDIDGEVSDYECVGLDKWYLQDGDNLQFLKSAAAVPEKFDTSKLTNGYRLLYDCSSIRTIPAFDTSKITNFEQMFSGCNCLNNLPSLDTSSATNTRRMFYACNSMASVPQLDLSNVTDAHGMFYNCSALTRIGSLDTSKVTDMADMFYGCSRLTTIECIDLTSVTSTGSAFPSSLTSLTLAEGSSINVGGYTLAHCSGSLDYDSVKGVLKAAANTTNTNAKQLTFARTIEDQDGELAALKAEAESKGWTFAGLTIN